MSNDMVEINFGFMHYSMHLIQSTKSSLVSPNIG